MQVVASPRRAGAVGLLVAAAVLAVVGVTTDVAGAVLALPGAAVALVLGLRDLLVVPVLRADEDGLVVVQGLTRRAVGWDEVRRLRVVRDRRAVLLELDLDDDVVLLSALRLGRDPRDVLEQLQQVRPVS